MRTSEKNLDGFDYEIRARDIADVYILTKTEQHASTINSERRRTQDLPERGLSTLLEETTDYALNSKAFPRIYSCDGLQPTQWKRDSTPIR